MRAWLPVLLLLLSGCTDPSGAPDAPPPDEPTRPQSPEPPTPDATPLVLPVFNGTLSADAPGGAGRALFDVPASGYAELFVNTHGPVRVLGNLSVVFEAPDGGRTVYAEGAFVQDDAEGVAVPGASRGDWRLRIPVQGGDWTIAWSVDGELSLPLTVEAL